MTALNGDLYALTGQGTLEQVEGSPVTANLLPMLGVSPVVGRISQQRKTSPVARVVLISHGLCQRSFASDRKIIGRAILLNGQSYQIIGVMPSGIAFPERSQIWVPLALGPRERATRDATTSGLRALQPGISLAQARREMSGLAANSPASIPRRTRIWGRR